MEQVNCALCGAPEYEVVFVQRDWNQGFAGEFPLVQCRRCGLLYRTPRPTADEMGDFYPATYTAYYPEHRRGEISWGSLLRYLKWWGMRRAVTRVKAGGKILDIGCATGGFLAAMRQTGDWALYGVEPSPYAAQYARDHLGLEVHAGQLPDAAYPADLFDVVTLWHVFEHLYTPRATLVEIHRVLKPDGVLLMAVPNAASLDARLFGKYWIGADAPRHLYVYTPATLTALLERAGFRVRRMMPFYGQYGSFALSVRNWLRGHNITGYALKIVERVLFFPLWRYLMKVYFWVLDRLNLGAVLLVYAEKAN